jgi:hypothetical protein
LGSDHEELRIVVDFLTRLRVDGHQPITLGQHGSAVTVNQSHVLQLLEVENELDLRIAIVPESPEGQLIKLIALGFDLCMEHNLRLVNGVQGPIGALAWLPKRVVITTGRGPCVGSRGGCVQPGNRGSERPHKPSPISHVYPLLQIFADAFVCSTPEFVFHFRRIPGSLHKPQHAIAPRAQ